ncbi:MAG: MATE family efflux transporter, partial [Pseudomonadota bacterium]|nr:MATE family efflux transporter [Pseudomonadota bacterium]
MKKNAITLPILLALAIPSMASALLNNFYRVIDQYAVHWLGTESQAAIGSSTFILIACYGLFLLISGGVTPFVARATGAGNPEQRSAIIGSSCLAMTAISVVYCLVLYFGAAKMADLVGVTGQTEEQMITYLQWLGISGF